MENIENTALTVVQRATVALKADARRAQFTELAAQSKDITAITNPAAYQECHAARMRLKGVRVEVEKEGKRVREDAVAFQRGVIEIEKELIALIAPEESRLQVIQDAHDTKIKEVREAAAREAQAKIEAAERERKQAEEARLAAERAEIARRQAELDKAEREARKRIEAEEREARKKTEAAAELLRQEQRAEEARLYKIRQEEQAHRDAEEARIRAERDKLEAERRSIEEAKRKEREAQEAKDRQARLEAEEFQRKEREAAEAVERERKRVAYELQSARSMLSTFLKTFGHLPEFDAVAKAIQRYLGEKL